MAINRQIATIQQGEWFCEDSALLQSIRAVSPGYLPDYDQALVVADLLGGVIKDGEPESAEGEVDSVGRLLIH